MNNLKTNAIVNKGNYNCSHDNRFYVNKLVGDYFIVTTSRIRILFVERSDL